ncbi:MAG: hypothetical protein ACFB4J_11320 [Elainellaceae cyanobacterium]
MVKSNDILIQAEQGSVAAIIQVLNQQLSDSGIRVRAVLVSGVLQLLCEAADATRLERQHLVQHIQQILESLHPRHIRRVRINSRILNEQQQLWLEEINRNPGDQLLWSEDIVLSWQNPITQITKSWQRSKETTILSVSEDRQQREQRQLRRALLGGALLGMGILLLSWGFYGWLRAVSLDDAFRGARTRKQASEADTPDRFGEILNGPVLNSVSEAPRNQNQSDRNPADPSENGGDRAARSGPLDAVDPFADAVRLAEAAATAGQTASTPAEWAEIATAWQQASELMGQIRPDDERYATAQNRHQLYQQYEAAARSQAARQ